MKARPWAAIMNIASARKHQEIYTPAHPLLELIVGQRVIARLERLPEMSGCERAEGEPEYRRMRELAAQFVAEQQIVERNQHDPVRQTDDADEENPSGHAAHEVQDGRRAD